VPSAQATAASSADFGKWLPPSSRGIAALAAVLLLSLGSSANARADSIQWRTCANLTDVVNVDQYACRIGLAGVNKFVVRATVVDRTLGCDPATCTVEGGVGSDPIGTPVVVTSLNSPPDENGIGVSSVSTTGLGDVSLTSYQTEDTGAPWGDIWINACCNNGDNANPDDGAATVAVDWGVTQTDGSSPSADVSRGLGWGIGAILFLAVSPILVRTFMGQGRGVV
jgi:hypothetical protein